MGIGRSGDHWYMERFSKSQLITAGKAVVGPNPEVTPDLLEAFRVARAWREAHLEPMRRLRLSVASKVRAVTPVGLSAGRLKRFQSIRRKLKGGRISLYQMQDIAGARAIVPSIADVEAVSAAYLESSERFSLVNQRDYIASPKDDGYRSRHIVVRLTGYPDLTGDNRITAEIQVRTKLQHAWATAVEAVGLARGENLKAGEGDPLWRRFFELVSAEFAEIENCPVGPSVSDDSAERGRELRDLVGRTNALVVLDGYRQAIRESERYLSLKGQSYVVRYDPVSQSVYVDSFSAFSRLSSADPYNSSDANNEVVVEVDAAYQLKEAYPNYFLDVTTFLHTLKNRLAKRTKWRRLAELMLKT